MTVAVLKRYPKGLQRPVINESSDNDRCDDCWNEQGDFIQRKDSQLIVIKIRARKPERQRDSARDPDQDEYCKERCELPARTEFVPLVEENVPGHMYLFSKSSSFVLVFGGTLLRSVRIAF